MRDGRVPGTGQSVRFNHQQNTTRIITPNVSASTASAQSDSPSFASRLRNASQHDSDDGPITYDDDGASFPLLLEGDPFAATSPLQLKHPRLPDLVSPDSSTSLQAPPSDMVNLFDMSNDLDAIPTDGSLTDMPSAYDLPPPPRTPDSRDVSKETSYSPVNNDTDFYSVSNTSPEGTIAPNNSISVNTESQNPQPVTNTDTFFSYSPKHPPMPSETPTIRPYSSQDSLRTPMRNRGESINEITVYHTPPSRDDRGQSESPAPSTIIGRETPQRFFDVFPDQSLSISHPVLLAPNNSTIEESGEPFPSLISAQDHLVDQLRERLEILEELTEQYERDLSARDDLVEELTCRVDAAESESEAWRIEIDRKERQQAKLKKAFEQLSLMTEKLKADQKSRGMFDVASGKALQALHSRINSLDAGKMSMEEEIRARDTLVVQERERAKLIEGELHANLAKREEAEAAQVALVTELQKWKERVQRLEKEGARAAEVLNQLQQDFGFDPVTEPDPAARLSVIFLGDRGGPNFGHGGGMDREAELKTEVSDLKEEIIRREQEYANLQDYHRTSEFSWAEERIALVSSRDEALNQLAAKSTKGMNATTEVEEVQTRLHQLEADRESWSMKSAEAEAKLEDALDIREQLQRNRDKVKILRYYCITLSIHSSQPRH